MSFYARTATAIISAAFVIILSGLFAGAYFLTRHISDAIEKDMRIVVDIADKYVTNEIKLLKLQAVKAAETISLSRRDGGFADALERALADSPAFIGLAVFDGTSRLDSLGEPVPPDLAAAPFMATARAGGQTVSTTRHSPNGALVMYVSAPMGNGLVLAAVLPGLYFSDLLSQFTVYRTGHLFVDDADGHIIVNRRREWVEQRINFIEMARGDKKYQDIAAVVRRGISGEQGTSRFTVDGVPRICAFRPVSSSDEGWFVGLIAPLSESPLKEISGGMLMIGVITFALSVGAALLTASLLKRPYEEMERLRKTAETASKAKSDFLATMSHEIRTPLNAVIGLSELSLGEENLSSETESNLEKIYSAGSTILSIVNDVLDISKIESGKFEIYPVLYDTPSLINDTVILNIVRIGEKPISFALDIDADLPGALYGDDLRVKQIFNNLLSNAFKFTHAGVVEWRVSFERDENSVWLISSIRDSGIGIKQEDLHRLFDDYNQVDTRTNRRVEGTGLGLAITRRLVEMMDGKITVESEYGAGATFHVRLRQTLASEAPIGKAVAENLANLHYTLSKRARGAKLARVDLSYAHVLVVDDIETNLDVARGMMKPYKMNIDCATGGPQAIEMIRAGSPRYNAVFMDHMMPGLDGVEATRIIREELGTDYARNIPIIALTANALVGNEEMFLRQGFQAFLSKPIDRVKLDSILRCWVRDKSLEKELVSLNETEDLPDAGRGCAGRKRTFPAGTALRGIEKDRLLARFGGDESVCLDVLRSYAANLRSLLRTLKEYLAAEKLEEYAIVIHGLKGSSYGVCAREAGKAAEALERAAKAGNLEAVKAGHPAFEKVAAALSGEIEKILEDARADSDKPVSAAPDPALLRELREACAAFDMDRVDAAMERLESFRYENGGTLVAWLREQVTEMNFENIFNGNWLTQV